MIRAFDHVAPLSPEVRKTMARFAHDAAAESPTK
jgi:hypothetical protein